MSDSDSSYWRYARTTETFAQMVDRMAYDADGLMVTAWLRADGDRMASRVRRGRATSDAMSGAAAHMAGSDMDQETAADSPETSADTPLINLVVVKLNGEAIDIGPISACNSIADLQDRIHRLHGVPPSSQRILLGDSDITEASPESQLQSLGVSEGTVLTFAVRYRQPRGTEELSKFLIVNPGPRHDDEDDLIGWEN